MAAVNQLSGGSKAHWLSRAYSQAFLMRSTADRVVEEATVGDIVDRLVDVLVQGVASLAQMGRDAAASASTEPASPRRFEFVHNPALRPVVEQAYAESRRALEQGQYGSALLTSCGILEAIVTDALEHNGFVAVGAGETAAVTMAAWSFEARLAAAEKAGLIRGGCARLPPVARTYRNIAAAERAGPAWSSQARGAVTGQGPLMRSGSWTVTKRGHPFSKGPEKLTLSENRRFRVDYPPFGQTNPPGQVRLKCPTRISLAAPSVNRWMQLFLVSSAW